MEDFRELKVLEKVGDIGNIETHELRDCICRKQRDLLGTRKCDFTLDACLVFRLKKDQKDHTALLKKKPSKLLTALKKWVWSTR